MKHTPANIITKEQVEKIASVSRLTLSDQEISILGGELSNTVNYIDTLSTIDTKNIIPTFQTNRLTNVYREDRIEPCLSQESALSNAKKVYQGYFMTKSIFVKDE